MSDLVHPLGDINPRERRHRARRDETGFTIGGTQRIHPQHMFDVGQHQFLVLLLVVGAEFDERRRRMRRVVPDRLDQGQHRLVDVATIVQHLCQRGACGQTALGTAMPLPGLEVVRVEQEGVARVG